MQAVDRFRIKGQDEDTRGAGRLASERLRRVAERLGVEPGVHDGVAGDTNCTFLIAKDDQGNEYSVLGLLEALLDKVGE